MQQVFVCKQTTAQKRLATKSERQETKEYLTSSLWGKRIRKQTWFPCVPERTARKVRLLWQISLQESRKKSIQRFWIDFYKKRNKGGEKSPPCF